MYFPSALSEGSTPLDHEKTPFKLSVPIDEFTFYTEPWDKYIITKTLAICKDNYYHCYYHCFFF